MKRSTKKPEQIEMKIQVASTPQALYRALTSQTELRRWWAPRVILSRNIISQVDGQDIELILLQSDPNRMVRYSWRRNDSEDPATVISFEITDLGESRSNVGEGVELSMIHDGWVSREERTRQAKIWKEALHSLRERLEGRDFKPWWEREKGRSEYRQVKLPRIKQFIEKIEIRSRVRSDKKSIPQGIWKMSQSLDTLGTWHMKEGENELDFRCGSRKIFSISTAGEFTLFWEDLEQSMAHKFQDFVDRLVVEQDLDLRVDKTKDRFLMHELHMDFWIQWCIDVVQHVRESE